ncbi:hypothetical protein [Thiocystis violascens]|uniref:Uncharacterized protein n=1 Tax=Thiocystis violascens (strain ATCC 17096 / DSM 198 / 6111) TaxID=765911 RepID=I3YGT7_THIV6|nr:hypothetical protein [Thiocystis violascens]AFL76205.1 hypothetical protein Thivi_4402 [Thiocystis violascens DSM 198]
MSIGHPKPDPRERRQIDAALIRECAYASVAQQLRRGQIGGPEAVIALRHAYHRAERHARALETVAQAA